MLGTATWPLGAREPRSDLQPGTPSAVFLEPPRPSTLGPPDPAVTGVTLPPLRQKTDPSLPPSYLLLCPQTVLQASHGGHRPVSRLTQRITPNTQDAFLL